MTETVMERKQTCSSRKRLSLTDGSWRLFSFKLSTILSFCLIEFAQVELVELKGLEDTLGLSFYIFLSILLIIPLPSHQADTELGVILIAPRNTYLVVGNARLRVSNKGQEQTPSHMGVMVK